jgi:hypothetical protein
MQKHALMTRKFLGCVSLAVVGALTSQAEAASPLERYQPTIDITKDPGCGKALKTKEERIAHNRKLAELYFINFQKDRENGRNYG